MSAQRAALVILDGFGYREDCTDNAVCHASMPCYRELRQRWPRTLIEASGEAVGLPRGQMGNSEVGHLNLGAGRVVYQDLVRIGLAIDNGELCDNAPLNDLCERVRRSGGCLHFVGLLSDGGVHSHMDHLLGFLRYATAVGVQQVRIHAILDGRDTAPRSGRAYVESLQAQIAQMPGVELATLVGRFYAMDRDKRWERVELAYRLMALAQAEVVAVDPLAAIAEQYDRDVTDEFLEPIRLECARPMEPEDGLFFWNFRADRARELTQALALDRDLPFETPFKFRSEHFLCLTEYAEDFGLPVAFGHEELGDILGEVVSRAGCRQLRIAETEKYAHVTFFFNGGLERQYDGEDRELIPSPRDVRTYDLKPEMSAAEVASRLEARLAASEYELVVLNFANPDMVGHTGDLQAAVRACEAMDAALSRVLASLKSRGFGVLVTADHGNAELMATSTGPHTAHTTNPVELVAMVEGCDDLRAGGCLADVAPTLLELMGLAQPAAMTGRSLLRVD